MKIANNYSRKTTITLWSLCLLCGLSVSNVLAQPLDPAYHDNAEILAELQYYARQYSAWMSLDSIGYSAEDSLPIWCVKLSDNPDQIEPEAALLFIGQVHAEEVVGIELTLEIVKQMLENNGDNLMRQRLEGLDIYIIPTANPEGLDVVHSGVDITYRKNKRDNVGDGVLRISDREGWDTSGVDINRNFSMHWDRGDTLFRPEATFRYNAYRGSAPFSEPESRALRDLALSRQFLYSIVYHSSRSGANTELLIGPWYWSQGGVVKRPPDAPAINALGEALADLMPVQNFDSTYWYGQSTQRKGQLQDWFYSATGCIQYMAEIGDGIHPEEEVMRQIVSDQLPAVWYLMDLALGLEGLEGYGTLTVIATDAESGGPIDANIEIENLTHPVQLPRKTQSQTGRFDWLVPAGEHALTVSKFGFDNRNWENFEIPNRERTVLEVELTPETLYQPVFVLIDTAGNPIAARIQIQELKSADIFDLADGSIGGSSFPPGDYLSLTTNDRVIPTLVPFHVTPEHMLVVGIGMSYGTQAYNETFTRVQDWPHSGNNWGIVSFDGRTCLTESVVGDYPSSSNLWLELPNIVHLDTAEATMRIIHLPYCEPKDDYQQIEWWTNPQDIHSKRYSQLRRFRRPPAGDGTEEPDWDTLYISLDSLERGDLSVRFRTVTDEAIGEDGWLIDEVAVFVEGYEASVFDPAIQPATFNLQLFPNPFNSILTIRFQSPHAIAGGAGWVSLCIYDISGRLVVDLLGRRGVLQYAPTAGTHKVVWDASSVGAGVYFVRLEAGEEVRTEKIVLIR